MTDARRILIVEDEVMIAMMIEDMLTDMGHQVIGIGASCAEALSLIAATPCDGAIVDINLGGEKSWPVADALAGRGIAFAFASGGDEARPAPHSDVPVLDKPFQARALEAIVAQMARQD